MTNVAAEWINETMLMKFLKEYLAYSMSNSITITRTILLLIIWGNRTDRSQGEQLS